MIATSAINNVNHADLKTGTASEILQHIDDIYRLLQRASVPVRPYTTKSVNILLGLGEDTRKMILQRLQSWKTILESPNVSLENVDEKILVDKALGYFNFNLKNHDWDNTSHDEIIEIYNLEGIQLYRSLNFFQTCGYSLLDLCVNEWFVLWERPRAVVEKISKTIEGLITGQKTNPTVEIPPHLIRETYDDGTTQPFCPRAAVVEFKNIYPAYGNSGEIIGFVVTSKGRLISIGDDAMKMDFI
jgi:hypothetical protein